jgi:hypothetical protein
LDISIPSAWLQMPFKTMIINFSVCLLELYQPIAEVGLCTWPMFAAHAQIAQMLLLGVRLA